MPGSDTASASFYTPTPEQEDLIRLVNQDFERWRQDRRPHEIQWFINGAFLRGQQYVEQNAFDQKLSIPPAPPHRVRLTINLLLAKIRARMAKLTKNRPIPIVVPATTLRKDRLDARGTQKMLDYLWRKLRLEQAFRDALLWATIGSKGFWWFHWNPSAMARVKITDPALPEKYRIETAPLGDIEIEVGSPFEVLVAEPGQSSLAKQPRIIRAKMRPIEELKARYPEAAPYLQPDTSQQEVFHYERQLAQLNTRGIGGYGIVETRMRDQKGAPTHTIVKEWFEAPTAAHPKGRHAVVAAGVLLSPALVRDPQSGEPLRDAEGRMSLEPHDLPFGFSDLDNPYPCAAFSDLAVAGQFWGPTVTEQLIGLSRELNLVRSKVSEQFRMMAHPKILVAKQHQIQKSAWTSEAGEVIEYIAIPNIPPPQPWMPPPISADAWRVITMIKEEFDDLTQIHPQSEGQVGGAKSGFQTNLLQEATDAVHAPDIRMHELTIEEASFKLRRMAKLGYTIPRLLTVSGKNHEPDAFEFGADDIDEHAEIIIQAGSAFPTLKAAKISAVMELANGGWLGNQQDPEVRRRVLTLLDVGGLEEAYENARLDEEQAGLENTAFEEGRQVAAPEFWQDHTIHYSAHTDQLKSPEVKDWPPPQRLSLIAHTIQHGYFINPAFGQTLSMQYAPIFAQMGMPPPAPPIGAPPPQPAMPGPAQSAAAGPPPPVPGE